MGGWCLGLLFIYWCFGLRKGRLSICWSYHQFSYNLDTIYGFLVKLFRVLQWHGNAEFFLVPSECHWLILNPRFVQLAFLFLLTRDPMTHVKRIIGKMVEKCVIPKTSTLSWEVKVIVMFQSQLSMLISLADIFFFLWKWFCRRKYLMIQCTNIWLDFHGICLYMQDEWKFWYLLFDGKFLVSSG